MEDFTEFENIFHSIPENKDGSAPLFSTYNVVPTDPSILPKFSDVSGIITGPVRAISGAATTIYDKATGIVKGTYMYLVGGVVLVGVLAIVLLGVGTKFMKTAQGE